MSARSPNQIRSVTFSFTVPENAVVEGRADRRVVRIPDSPGGELLHELTVEGRQRLPDGFAVESYVDSTLSMAMRDVDCLDDEALTATHNTVVFATAKTWSDVCNGNSEFSGVTANTFRRGGTVRESAGFATQWISAEAVIIISEHGHLCTVNAYSKDSPQNLRSAVTKILENFAFRDNHQWLPQANSPWLFARAFSGNTALSADSARILAPPVSNGKTVTTETFQITVPPDADIEVAPGKVTVSLGPVTNDVSAALLVVDTVIIEHNPFDEEIFARFHLESARRISDLVNINVLQNEVTNRKTLESKSKTALTRQSRTWRIDGDINPDSWEADTWARSSSGFIFSANDYFHKFVVYYRADDPLTNNLVEQILDSLSGSDTARILQQKQAQHEEIYAAESMAEAEDEERTQIRITRILPTARPDQVTVEELETAHYEENGFALRLKLPFLDNAVACELEEKSWRHFSDELTPAELPVLRQKLADSLTMLRRLPENFADKLGVAALNDYQEMCDLTDVYPDDGVEEFDPNNPLNIITPRDAWARVIHEQTRIHVSDPHLWQGHLLAALYFTGTWGWGNNDSFAVIIRDGEIVGQEMTDDVYLPQYLPAADADAHD